ncbi:tyrosine-type recombinase/integrase [Methylopila henanensis]|uniref:Tyrosine-type recombinase/integrase n=1 Tax=Methylopila henanensis TaxID=873516 RepID=A0ABW4K0H4_9HYPH
MLVHERRGYRTWTEADITAFRKKWPVGAPVRLAFEILLYTGLRRADAVRLGWCHIVDDDIVITTSQSRHSTELHIPIHAELRAVLKGIPRDAETFVTTIAGEARTAKGFTSWICQAAHDAGLPSNSSPHGLRKAICRRLADADCDALTIMSITGHKNLAEVMPYIEARDRRRRARAGIAALAVDKSVKSANLPERFAHSEPKPLLSQAIFREMARPTGVEPVFSA